MSSYNGIIEQSTRRKQNLLLEPFLTSKDTRNIGHTIKQGLEHEERAKSTILLRILEKNTKEVIQTEKSWYHINMVKLAKMIWT